MHKPHVSSHILSLLAALVLWAAACNTSGLPSTQTAPAILPATSIAPTNAVDITASAPEAATPAEAQTKVVFRAAVIVDVSSEPVRREQAQGLFDEANKLLSQLVPIGLELADFVEDSGGGATNDMAQRYMVSHAAALPNGIVLFSFGDNGQAKLYGGYSYTLPGPAGFKNAFASPVVGADQIYVAVVHFGHKYAACGYGGSDTVQSSTSLDGECRNQPGTACVQQNGYSMCANAIGNLYMSTPTYAVSSTIIHELLHPFAPGGDQDHYATPECNARMGYPNGFFDLQESEYYNGLCPFVYENFKDSYQP